MVLRSYLSVQKVERRFKLQEEGSRLLRLPNGTLLDRITQSMIQLHELRTKTLNDHQTNPSKMKRYYPSSN